MKALLPCLLACSLMLASCGGTVNTEGTFVVDGTISKVSGGDACWCIEVGKTIAQKQFYQLNGDESILRRLQRQDAHATVRLKLDSTATPRCRIGTPAIVVDIIAMD